MNNQTTYEQYRNAIMVKLQEVPEEYLNQLLNALDSLAEEYEVSHKCTAIATIDDRMNEYIATYLVVRKSEGLSDLTIKTYKYCLMSFSRAMRKPIEEISAMDVRLYLHQYQTTNDISNRSLDSVRTTISTFFTWLVDNEYLEKNPMRNIKQISYERKPRDVLTREEVTIIRESINNITDRVIMEILFGTGCRVSELANLKKSDINMTDGTVHILGKGRKHRTSYITPEIRVVLSNYYAQRKDNSPYVLVSERLPYDKLSTSAIQRRVKIFSDVVARATGKHITPHVYRHTFATGLVTKGANITTVSHILGHSNVQTSMTYIRVSDEIARRDYERCMA